MKKKWYQDWRSWIAILFLIFPLTSLLGLIIMWMLTPWPKKTKIIITIVGVIISLITAIILLVSGASLLVGLKSYEGAKTKANDARRKADVSIITQGAKMYCAEFGTCPESTTEIVNEGYLTEIPTDPETNQSYQYQQTQNGQNCQVSTVLSTEEEFSVPCF